MNRFRENPKDPLNSGISMISSITQEPDFFRILLHLHMKDIHLFHLNIQYERNPMNRFRENPKDPKLNSGISMIGSITQDPDFFRIPFHLHIKDIHLFHLNIQYEWNRQSHFWENPKRVLFSAFFSTNRSRSGIPYFFPKIRKRQFCAIMVLNYQAEFQKNR